MVQLNPDIPGVPIPEAIGATSPISQPHPNTAKGELFGAIGKSLADAGDLIKEGYKVREYTNKKDIQNREQIDLDSERESMTARQEGTNAQLTGVSPGLATAGLMKYGEDESPLSTNAPNNPLQNFPQQAGKLAAARINQDQLDIYYQGRINQVLKTYRNAYPEYKDWVDTVAERHGFGNSANKYLSALSRANTALQGQIDQANPMKEMLPLIKDDFHDGVISPDTFNAAITGNAEAIAKWQDIHYKTRGSEYNWKIAKTATEGVEGFNKFNEDHFSRAVASRFNDIVSNDMGNTEPGHLGYNIAQLRLLESQGTSGQDVQQKVLQLKMQSDARFNLLRNQMAGTANETVEMNRPDPMTGEPVPSGIKRPISYLVKPEVLQSHQNNALGTAQAILNDAGTGNMKIANIGADYVQAYQNDYLRSLMFSSDFAAAYATAKATAGTPEAFTSFVNAWITPDKLEKLGKQLNTVATDHGANILAGKETIPDALEKVKGPNSGPLNTTILDVLPATIISKNIPPETKTRVADQFFNDRTKGLIGRMPAPQRAAFYANITTPDVVAEMKKLGPDRYNQYKDYVTNEYRDGVFRKELNDVKNFDLTSVPGLKITYNDRDHSWGVDIGKDKNVNLSNYNYTAPNAVGFEGNYIKTISATVNRLNMATHGLSNVLQGEGDEKKVDAYLHNILDGADKDQVSIGSLGGRMVGALLTMAKKNNEANQKLIDKANEDKQKVIDRIKENASKP